MRPLACLLFLFLISCGKAITPSHMEVSPMSESSSISSPSSAVETVPHIRKEGNQWILETGSIRKVLALEEGRFFLKSLLDKTGGLELIADPSRSDEFAFTLGVDGPLVTGSTPEWRLVGDKQATLSQGEQQLEIELQRGSVAIKKTYVVYPHSSVIREWVTFRNAGSEPLTIVEPEFLRFSPRLGDPASGVFHWMTGGECLPGSWDLRTESLSPTARTFDSYEPFPLTSGSNENVNGDGGQRQDPSERPPGLARVGLGLFKGFSLVCAV